DARARRPGQPEGAVMALLDRILRRGAPAEADDGATRMHTWRYDRVLLAVTFALMGLGVVMIYSASIVSAEARTGDGAFYLKRQIAYIGVALMGLIAGLNIHHDLWRRLARPAFIVAVLMLMVVLVPGISAHAKGASRWIDLGPFRFQPSEAVKLAWIVFLARFLAARQHRVHELRATWGVPAMCLAGLGALLMAQPDFGSTLICSGLMVLMIWAAGARWLHVGALFFAGAALIPVAIIAEPYRIKRLLAFLDPENDPQGVAYHINQALISFGSGDWTGMGLGGSRQKLLYLPEAHTDFIFSILGEELGVLGVALVITLFAIFVWRGFRIARRAPSAFGALLAFGLTAEIGFQAATNMAVATALLPTKGLTLPFVSYGGSSILLLGTSVGILLNVSRGEPPPEWLHRFLPDADVKARKVARRAPAAAKEAAA
ncbi:MAG: putative lipid II flippase FtsW, partial [Myxococcales bacterium]|nr:putative lipid II flippase FtsW [Myxococcales bacterium]